MSSAFQRVEYLPRSRYIESENMSQEFKKRLSDIEVKVKGVVTLCGSNRFRDEFRSIGENLETQGYCVLMPVYFRYKGQRGYIDDDNPLKQVFEATHKKRIELSDIVFILNVDHYTGKSTGQERDYALKLGKRLIFYTDWISRDYHGQQILLEKGSVLSGYEYSKD